MYISSYYRVILKFFFIKRDFLLVLSKSYPRTGGTAIIGWEILVLRKYSVLFPPLNTWRILYLYFRYRLVGNYDWVYYEMQVTRRKITIPGVLRTNLNKKQTILDKTSILTLLHFKIKYLVLVIYWNKSVPICLWLGFSYE